MSTIVKDKDCFVETDCIFTFGNGKSFESGGSFLLRNKKTNKLEGLFYAFEEEGKVGTWDGSIKVKSTFTHEWYSNMGDKRQSVYFTWDNVPMYGVYYKTNSQIVRAKQTKS